MYDDDKIIHKIRRPIGKTVAFKYPLGESDKRGILLDRAVVKSNPGENNVQYWDVVDLLSFAQISKPHNLHPG